MGSKGTEPGGRVDELVDDLLGSVLDIDVAGNIDQLCQRLSVAGPETDLILILNNNIKVIGCGSYVKLMTLHLLVIQLHSNDLGEIIEVDLLLNFCAGLVRGQEEEPASRQGQIAPAPAAGET